MNFIHTKKNNDLNLGGKLFKPLLTPFSDRLLINLKTQVSN